MNGKHAEAAENGVFTIIQTVAKIEGKDARTIKTVPLPIYQTQDDYYAVFGPDPAMWLRDWQKVAKMTFTALQRTGRKVIPIEIKHQEYYEWLKACGRVNQIESQIEYALITMNLNEPVEDAF